MPRRQADITVLWYETGKDPVRVTIANQLVPMQKLVGGYIETVRIAERLTLVCNEEGRIHGLPFNREVPGPHLIFGDFFVTAAAGGEFASLTEAQISEALSLLEGGR